MKFIYHLKRKNFVGKHLIPLNYWSRDSDVFHQQSLKYKGREQINSVFLPKLNCLWNDVLHFSSVEPRLIFDYLKTFSPDHGKAKFEYFKIPIEHLIDQYPVALYSCHKNLPLSWEISENEIDILTSKASYQELFTIPEETIDYWNEQKTSKGPYLLFNHIPHVFVKGVIDTTDFEVCQYP